jgi:hypothetical protein
MEKKFIALSLIIIVAIILFLIIQMFNKPYYPKDISGAAEEILKKIQTDKINDEEADELNSFGSSSGSDSGSNPEAGGGNQNQISENGCPLIQISYGLRNLKINEVCSSEDEPCPNKIVTCTLEVHNLDETTTGTFSINFNFKANGQTLNSVQQTAIVQANSINLFSVQSQFSEPEANEQITCAYSSLQIPQKEVCS